MNDLEYVIAYIEIILKENIRKDFEVLKAP